ncbi:unnamed protein product, partial [Prorocentrum cordatum]
EAGPRAGGACRDVLEALVALVAVHGRAPLPLQLLAGVLARAGPEAAAVVLERVEASHALLACLVDAMAEGEGAAAAEHAAALVLRLAERGSAALEPHLRAAGGRLSRLLAAVRPEGPSAAGTLALYSLCALRPQLLGQLLGDEPRARLRRAAEGVARCLASPAAAVRCAAACLAEQLAAAAPPGLCGGSWLGHAALAAWLVDCCGTCDDLASSTAAARALGYLADDADVLRRMHGLAIDALVDACARAAVSAADGPLEAPRELLRAAVGSLRRLCDAPCPTQLDPRRLLRLLGAALDAGPATGGASVPTTRLSAGECLEPLGLALAARPLRCSEGGDAEALGQALQVCAAHLSRIAAAPAPEPPGAICLLLSSSAFAVAPPAPNGAEGGLLSCARCLGGLPLRPESVLALAAALWPSLVAVEAPPAKWWETVEELAGLVPSLLLAPAGAWQGEDEQAPLAHATPVGAQPSTAAQLLAALVAPSLRAAGLGGTGGQQGGLELPAQELAGGCDGLLGLGRPGHRQALVAAGAALHAAAQGRPPPRPSRFRLLLDRVLGTLPGTPPPELPPRALVFLAAAAARAGHADEAAGVDDGGTVVIDAEGGGATVVIDADVGPEWLWRAAAAAFCDPRFAREWAWLRAGGVRGGGESLRLALAWLLEGAGRERPEADGVLRAALRHEAAAAAAPPSGESAALEGARMAWLASAVPS